MLSASGHTLCGDCVAYDGPHSLMPGSSWFRRPVAATTEDEHRDKASNDRNGGAAGCATARTRQRLLGNAICAESPMSALPRSRRVDRHPRPANFHDRIALCERGAAGRPVAHLCQSLANSQPQSTEAVDASNSMPDASALDLTGRNVQLPVGARDEAHLVSGSTGAAAWAQHCPLVLWSVQWVSRNHVR